MRFRTVVAGAFAGLVVASLGWAQQQEAASKIAFVDVEKAVVSIDEGKARLKELQDWIKPKQDELGRLSGEINGLQNELAAKRGAASDDLLGDINRRLIAKQREFEDKQRVAKRDFEQRQDTVLKELGEKLNNVISQYAESNRLTAVFILKPNDVAYLANSADITSAVVSLYNQRYPWPAKPAAAPGK